MFFILYCRSIYYHKDYTDNWKRVTLPLLNQTTYGTAVRFKWSQIYTVSSVVGGWAIDNIVIGNRSLHCPQLCRGHGRCTLSSTCVCDEGFSGNNCEEISAVFPNYIQVKSTYRKLAKDLLLFHAYKRKLKLILLFSFPSSRNHLKKNWILLCGLLYKEEA